ncbi:alternative ribosome rescue aminoacyl-tRNA hydrolase ArfB [Frondihabitans australicus]|uniref:Ribosome-associated protein n=1 Tax=Frondihabitans australicus TaxID=386892 RepID=A0A495IDZ1_9MICO|nr:alternative ribosome rescue aminoacyl-tRNA hydrolase ArfB [Frondihabitans australicus]RKR74207.1 ribosome-associated protein [Frondihabitans australicus]
MDLEVTPALTIPGAELRWRFSRSSGPGGQHVNTSDSRAQLSWNVATSAALDDETRAILRERLAPRLVRGEITVSASEQRSQLRNRETARARLIALIVDALAQEPPERRPTRPSRGAVRRRLDDKARRSTTKAQRRRPPLD